MRAFIICGPTASGKSEIALHVARELGGEIINADSRQVYRHMQIGTGWPSARALEQVPHHGYGIVDPDERYSAARYVADARQWIAAIRERGHMPLVVGGTGFYIEALAGRVPLNRPPADEVLRGRLRGEAAIHPAIVLHEWLASLDRAAAVGINPGDTYRTLRRLETVLAARTSETHVGVRQPEPPLHSAIVVLDVSPDVLRTRIQERVQAMFAAGLVHEAQAVRAGFAGASALSGLGYAEALAYHDGLASKTEAVALTQRRTLRYAKRQRTWFGHMHDVRRVAADDSAAAMQAVTRAAREFFAQT